MIKPETMTLRKLKVRKLACEGKPQYRDLAAWAFHLPGLLLFVVIVFHANRTFLGSFKDIGIRPVLIVYGGEDEDDYEIIEPM